MKYAFLMFTKLIVCANIATYLRNERFVGLKLHNSIHWETDDCGISWMH
jgi:hypothetical protein